MENATKALIIAGAVIITILVISLGVMVFKNYSDSVTSNSSLSEQEITEFNSQFTEYLGDTVQGSQVNALIQLVRSVNQKAITEDTSKIVQIKFPTTSGNVTLNVSTDSSGNKTVVFNPSTYGMSVETSGKYYTVTASDYTNGLISEITVKSN